MQAIRELECALKMSDPPTDGAVAEAPANAPDDGLESSPGSDGHDGAEPAAAANWPRRIEDVLADRNQQLRDILSACPLGVAVVSRQDWRRLFVNQHLVDMFKAPSVEAFREQDLKSSWVDAAEFARASSNIERNVDHVDFEAERRCFDGSTIWVLMNSRPIVFEGEPARVFWHNDITKRKRMENELRRMATTDTVTGLPNRRHLLSLVIREAKRQSRSRSSFGLLMVDLDNFKIINDTHGHACGDRVLRQVAQLCQATVRDIDTLGRVGGEEFAVLAPDTDEKGVRCLAERLRQVVADTDIEVEPDCRLRVTISVGATLFSSEDNTIDVTLARADKALYEAKDAGRNRVRFV